MSVGGGLRGRGARAVNEGRVGAGVKNALPALGSGERQTGAKAKDTSKRLEEEIGSAGVRRGGKDTLVRLGGEATPRARAAERACGGRGGRE